MIESQGSTSEDESRWWVTDWPQEPDQVALLHGEDLYTAGELTLAERKLVVDQAIELLEQTYAHREQKQAAHGADPGLRLRAHRRRLNHLDERDLEALRRARALRRRQGVKAMSPVKVDKATLLRPRAPEIEFHREMTSIFTSLRDRHTLYLLPKPFSELIAFLPFDVEKAVDEKGHQRYYVTRVISEIWPLSAAPPNHTSPVAPGWTVEAWNGQAIEFAVESNGADHPGSNPAARLARGLERLTSRPLLVSPLPAEGSVNVRFRSPDKKDWEQNLRWLVRMVQPKPAYSIGLDAHLSITYGKDIEVERLQDHRVQAYYADTYQAAREPRPAEPTAAPAEKTDPPETDRKVEDLDEIINLSGLRLALAQRIIFKNGGRDVPQEVGYIRIFSFTDLRPDLFRRRFEGFLVHNHMPKSGLIIDVRGNPGGLIASGESILQLLTPRPIQPQPFQFIVSPLTEKLCRHARGQGLQPNLSPWASSVMQGASTGTIHSRGIPISSPAICNERGQVYYGPVVLIVDANSYSTADIFAAGFKDHRIGPVIGTDKTTGGGGANVWSHSRLGKVLRGTGAQRDFARLPSVKGVDLSVAIRRSLRVGPNAGVLLEDFGVVPDYLYSPTRDDVLKQNPDLIRKAAEFLVRRELDDDPPRLVRLYDGKPTWPEPAERRLDLTRLKADPLKFKGKIRTAGIERLTVLVNGLPERLLPPKRDPSQDVGDREFDILRPHHRSILEIRGYARPSATSRHWDLVAAKRVQLSAVRR